MLIFYVIYYMKRLLQQTLKSCWKANWNV